jgi:hypothetical protein
MHRDVRSMNIYTICNETNREFHVLWEKTMQRAGLNPVTKWVDVETDGNFGSKGYGDILQLRAEWFAELCASEKAPFACSDVDVVAMGSEPLEPILLGPLQRHQIAFACEGRVTGEVCCGFWVAKPSLQLAVFWHDIAVAMKEGNLWNDQPLVNERLPHSKLNYGYLPDSIQSGTFRPKCKARIYHANNTIPRQGKTSMEQKREALQSRVAGSALAVIAHTEESLTWVEKLDMPHEIVTSHPTLKAAMRVKNEGREAGKWLRWLIENYYGLPQYIAFLQGRPDHHCRDFLEQLNGHEFVGYGFYPLGKVIAANSGHDKEHDEAAESFLSRHLGGKNPINQWVAGAQMVVHRSRIYRHGRSYYEEVLDEVLNNPLGPWAIERRWHEIF